MKVHNNAEIFSCFKTSKFGYLNTLKLSRPLPENFAAGIYKYEIEIVLSSMAFKNETLKIFATGLPNIEFGSLGGQDGIHVQISNIKNRQWEKLRFKIHDCEESAFSFYCETFTAEIIPNNVS